MKTLFVFSDVHSFYQEWQTALSDAGFDRANEDHILVSLGDLCDRGPDATKCVTFLNSIPKHRKICVIGNHELLLEEMIKYQHAYQSDYSNGTVGTVMEMTNRFDDVKDAMREFKTNRKWADYKNSWQWYAEIGHHIFVHGWIPCQVKRIHGKNEYQYDPDWRNASVKDFENASWTNGMEAWSQGIKEEGKTIYMGHWHSSYGHSQLHHDGVEFVDVLNENPNNDYANYKPFIDEGIVALDACTIVSHFVNVYPIQISDAEWDAYQKSSQSYE